MDKLRSRDVRKPMDSVLKNEFYAAFENKSIVNSCHIDCTTICEVCHCVATDAIF